MGSVVKVNNPTGQTTTSRCSPACQVPQTSLSRIEHVLLYFVFHVVCALLLIVVALAIVSRAATRYYRFPFPPVVSASGNEGILINYNTLCMACVHCRSVSLLSMPLPLDDSPDVKGNKFSLQSFLHSHFDQQNTDDPRSVYHETLFDQPVLAVDY